MRKRCQAGIAVAAFDAGCFPFTWDEVGRADERAVLFYPDHTLFLCWPPWNSDMAYNALAWHRGDYVVYVGEWMGGCANRRFFTLLASTFEVIDVVNIPQWCNRDDRLMIFKRRNPSAQPPPSAFMPQNAGHEVFIAKEMLLPRDEQTRYWIDNATGPKG